MATVSIVESVLAEFYADMEKPNPIDATTTTPGVAVAATPPPSAVPAATGMAATEPSAPEGESIANVGRALRPPGAASVATANLRRTTAGGTSRPPPCEVTPAALDPGSPEWCKFAPSYVQQALACIRRELLSLPKFHADLREQLIWERLGIASWENFCTEYLGASPEFVAAVMALTEAPKPSRVEEVRRVLRALADDDGFVRRIAGESQP